VGAKRLDREQIVDAATELVASVGERFTLAELGRRLGADPTAIYRHVRDKSELLRAVGDRLHAELMVGLPRGDWRSIVTILCHRLRNAHLVAPSLAATVRSEPPRQPGELALTERLLSELGRAGLDPHDAARAYHALIELAVGSAALDASVAALAPEERERTYASWRRAYANLDPAQYPASTAAAAALYAGTADDRFAYALDRLLDGIRPAV
jgi:TetR/AcrR family transcriptional regulator, tetracycline repressor protein